MVMTMYNRLWHMPMIHLAVFYTSRHLVSQYYLHVSRQDLLLWWHQELKELKMLEGLPQQKDKQ